MEDIFVETGSLTGDRERCEIAIKQGFPVEFTVKSERLGTLSFSADNLFSALSGFRLVLERDGYFLLCNVARRDAYPSRMTLQMGGGRKIYLLTVGKPAKRENLVDVFGSATIEQVCTVTEQRIAYEQWLGSLK